MTRVRADINISLDGFTSGGHDADNPMGEDWGRLMAAYTGTRTMQERVFGDTTGAGTTGIEDAYASAYFEGVGVEVMGAGMFGFHAFPDDPDWRGWWGEEPPFGFSVFVLTHSAPRSSLPFDNGTEFHFRDAPIADVLAEAVETSGGQDVRVGGGASTIRDAVRAGLVDDLHVAIAPIVLGRGHRFWDGLEGLENTHAVSSEVAESGTTHVTFKR